MDLVARFFGGGGKRVPGNRPSSASQRSRQEPDHVKVGRETAGRRGKGVTTVFDLPLDENGMLELAAKLKQRLRDRRDCQGWPESRFRRSARAAGGRIGKAGLQGEEGG